MANQSVIMENTPLFVVLAILIVGILVWRVKPAFFRQMHPAHLCIAAALFWGCLAFILVLSAWERYYGHFAPTYYRIAAPLAALFIYPLWSLALRWIALKLPGNPIGWFCILGGLQAICEHAVANYRFDLLRVPLLQESTPLAIFIFAFFEYMVYWGIVLLLAVVIKRARERFMPIPPLKHDLHLTRDRHKGKIDKDRKNQ